MNKKILGMVGISLLVLLSLGVGGASAWWNGDWDYSLNQTLSGVPSGGYVYNVTVHQGSGTNNVTDVFLNNHAQADYDDLRFILNDTTELNYWLENTSYSTTKAWVNIPNNGTLYLYYGNAAAGSGLNIENTFLFGDGFENSSEALTFGLIASTEYGQIDNITRITEAVNDFNSWNPDFVVELGDFICHALEYNKTLTLIYLDEVEATYDNLTMSRYYCFGNHDLDAVSKSEFFAHTGMSEKYYSFDKGNYHFIVLDPMYNASGGDIEDCNVTLGGGCPYACGGSVYVSEVEKTWLTNDLANTSKKTFVFCEQHLSGSCAISNAAAVRTILENSGKVVAAFTAQTSSVKETVNGIDYYKMFSMDASNPNAYAKIRVYADDSVYVEGIGEQPSYGSAAGSEINTTKWNIMEEDGTVTVDNGILDVNVTDTTANVGVSGKEYFDRPVIMECNVSRPGNLDTNMRRFWMMSSDNISDENDPIMADAFAFYHWGTTGYVKARLAGIETTVEKSFDGDYHNWKFAWKTDEVKFYLDNELNETITTNVTQNTTTPMFYGRSGGTAPTEGTHLYADWVFVRPYEDPEPALNTFSEENQYEGGSCTTPIITDLTNSTPGTTNVTITWSTNQTADNKVKYSKNSDLSNEEWSSWDNDTSSISIGLTSLDSGTPYYYQAWSYNGTNATCYVTEPTGQPYKTFTTEGEPPVVSIEITSGVGVILANSTTEGTVRQITPDSINVTLNSTGAIGNYILYIENTDPDLVKAYGSGITQSTHANNTIKLVFDLAQDTPKTIDLHRIWYPTRWSFIALGDTRPGNDNNSDLVSDQFVDIVNQLLYVNPLYPIPNMGDVVGGGAMIASSPVCTEAMHQAYWDFQNNKGIWYAMVGNHDQARSSNPQGSAQVIFDKSWGSSNFSYAFGDWYFIIANSYADDGTAPSESNAQGFLKNDQWNWTESEVTTHNESYNEIVMFHHPLWRYSGGEGGSQGSWQDANSNTNLRNLLVNSGVKLNIVGHEHFWHESTHDGMIQLVEGRGGAPLYEGETIWGFSVVELNAGGVVNITKVNITDGYSITTIYNNTNDYTKTTLKATIDNGHPMSIPCMLKFRMSDTNTTAYSVTGADYYDIIENDYGYVVIAQATASSTTEVIVSEVQEGSYTVSGRVTDTNGTAIKDVYIINDVTSATDFTNETGYYSLSNLGNGTYLISASKLGYKTNSTTAIVSGGDVSDADIVLEEGAFFDMSSWFSKFLTLYGLMVVLIIVAVASLIMAILTGAVTDTESMVTMAVVIIVVAFILLIGITIMEQIGLLGG